MHRITTYRGTARRSTGRIVGVAVRGRGRAGGHALRRADAPRVAGDRRSRARRRGCAGWSRDDESGSHRRRWRPPALHGMTHLSVERAMTTTEQADLLNL